MLKTYTLWACLLLTVSASFANSTHRVRAGENNHTIARKYGITVQQLNSANPGVNWNRLQIGQSIRIPNNSPRRERGSSAREAARVSFPSPNSSHRVVRGDSDYSIARRFGLTVAQLHAMNPSVDFSPLRIGVTLRVHDRQLVAQRSTRPSPASTPRPRAGQAPVARPGASPSTPPLAPVANSPESASAPAVAESGASLTSSRSASRAPAPVRPVSGEITTINAEITGDNVSVRSGASTSSPRIRTVDSGTVARVVDRKGEWVRLTFSGGLTGWVSAQFLRNSDRQVTPLPAVTAPTAVASASRRAAPPARGVSRAGQEMLDTARSLIGIRYVWGGTSRRGFDCSGFVGYVMRQHGVSLPRTSREQWTRGRAVSRDALRAGDLVFFRTRGRQISHVGIFIGGNKFIHASSGGGRIRINELTGYYSRTYAGARRVTDRFVAALGQEDWDRFAATLEVEEPDFVPDPEPEPSRTSSRGTDAVQD